jgi:protein-disulfide isomerase
MSSQFETVVNAATLVAATAVSITLAAQWVYGRRPQQPNRATRQAVADVAGRLETPAASPATRRGHSRIVLIEFADFQCSYCGSFARSVYPQIQREFIDNGKVEYWFRHYPLEGVHPLALSAAVAAKCAEEQGQFWAMHDRLFRNQAALEPDDLIVHADRIGLDLERFRTCVDSGRADAINGEKEEGKRLGVVATPAFLLGTLKPDGSGVVVSRLINGAQPYTTFKSELEGAIKAFSGSND